MKLVGNVLDRERKKERKEGRQMDVGSHEPNSDLPSFRRSSFAALTTSELRTWI